MKSNYQTKITLLCKSCGSNDIQLADDKSYGKCNNCQREYPGGYDELVSLNQNRIDSGIDKMKKEVIKDAQEEINKMIKKAFGGR